ncbi:MAG: hypothetical protein IOC64_00530 [Methylobacterium sp.]|jgi:hypothetical protein|nr:hypothetical protein [Methylobacterium sp.]MCA3601540.1 hypothetical protein [Methylobacterium sp.]MCA3605204.1 hypothetical protein [Methylobacterium sp.]MCA3608777.1 hypothetical protein [Methylobacterium sp.]MCA3611663.1 hypothetical protein [Methylobacterium sp.]
MKLIHAGAGLLVLLAATAFWLALQLIPTDLGNSYMVAASILFASALVLFALASVGRAIAHEIHALRLAVMLPPAAPEPHAASPVVEPAVARPAAPVFAGAAAGAAPGGAMHADRSAIPEARILDNLERDLFAELKSPPLKISPLPDEPGQASATGDDSRDAALSRATRGSKADAGRKDDPILPPLPKLPDFERAPPMPGLIHDEDLARLSEARGELAPLERLDVVGAYDSGGTRFTMYSDGSVTAKGEGVDRRFPSLDDLRAFIDGGMRV